MSLPIAPESNRMRVASVAAINKAARPFGAMLAAAGVGVALATSLQIAVEVVAGVAMTPLMVLVEGAPLGLFLFAFPLLWSATASPVGGLAILVIATCLLSTIVKRPGGFAKVTLLDWAVVALFASYGLSTLSASAPFDSHELGRLGEDFALYLVARSTATRVVPLARSLAALVAGSVVAALITGLAYFNGEARYLENIARLAESGIGINNFASILLAGCCLAAGLLGYSRRLVIRSLLVMASGIILLAVVLSQSRGALVGLTAAGVTALLISWRQRRRLAVGAAVVGAVLIGVVAWLPWLDALPGIPTYRARIGTLITGGSAFDNSRVTLWKMALEAFREHPFTGLGAGNFVHPLQYFQLAARVGAPPGFFGPDDSHSLYLGVLADLGLLGAVPLAVIVVLTVTRICRLVLHDSPDRRVTSVTHALAITTAGYLVAAAFIPVQDFQLPYILIGLVQGLAVAQSRVGRTLPESNLPGHVGRLSHS